jgi:hypothetical protein
MSKNWRYLLAAVSLCAAPAFADVWDIQTDNDDRPAGDNELAHGTAQTHDLGVRPGPRPDEDWFRIPQNPHTSYEVIVDGVSGDLAPGLTLDRLVVAGTNVALFQASVPLVGPSGANRVLRWANASTNTLNSQWIRVAGGACTIACGADDVYSIRLRETTVHVARFNSTGSNTTNLFVQNVTERTLTATVFFWGPSGTLLAFTQITLSPKGLIDLDTGVFAPGGSGHITIAHNGGWGALNAKASAYESATGFTFDTQGVNLP